MNIFLLAASEEWDAHMRFQARSYCDRHVVAMIREHTQMIATVLHTQPELVGASLSKRLLTEAPCKPMHTAGHVRHPCTLWTGQRKEHVIYLVDLSLALCDEHQYRYPSSRRHVYGTFLAHARDALAAKFAQPPLPTNFARAIKGRPELQTTSAPHLDVVDSYRDYYVRDKAAFARWTRRAPPSWYRARLAALHTVTT